MTAASPHPPAPYTSRELDETLARLGVPQGAPVAIALSGGADSLALVLLAAATRPVLALTVDHGLRPASSDEAATVAGWMAARGIQHRTLRWDGEKPASNIQAAARAARYDLLAAACKAANIPVLLTGHHADDQAETLLLRLARGSGLKGLGGIAPVRELVPGLSLVRPLLAVPKSRLVATLTAMGQDWIEDPSNESDAFDRVKARRLLADPPLEGLTVERLAATAERLRQAQAALDHYQTLWEAEAIERHPAGHAVLRADRLGSVPEETELRALADLIRWLGGQDFGPRLDSLSRLYADLKSQDFAGATLGGCQFVAEGHGRVLCVRELAAMAPRTAWVQGALYDGRWLMDGEGEGLEIGALGTDGWRTLRGQALSVSDRLEGILPRAARLVLPAVFSGDELVALPTIGITLRPDCSVRLSLQSLGLAKK
ncbi:tRNA lysidine(34) synthetase TilS [Gimibacter soli]|uniref:tRNA(Ile)-lysidine synthase n=1 Tax=Gimibacter soli TaxID=3024400 RepID=A0AAE9XVL7_9PROT|nr:tRNA lysidine(34) synthetase TilS [Gimibacter soli]WCL53784.1 tRNA lysidine(34) synthetase TilS [Gimibacter soli]